MSGSLLLALAVGCAPAWHPPAVGRFDLQVPEGWEVARNYRAFGVDTVVLAHGAASISVTVRREGPAERLPLDLVAGVRALSWGRRVGVENLVIAEHELVVDGRRACAVTGMRRWRTARTGYTMVYLRAAGRAAELVLHAPSASLDLYANDWGRFLDGFRLQAPPEPDGPLFTEDTWLR